MPTYDLYHTASGELLRSQDMPVEPVNPAGKPWAWKLREQPDETPGHVVDWSPAEREWVSTPLAGGVLAAAVTAAAETKAAAINAERERRVYLPIGAVDVAGDGSLMVEPDVRNGADRANLVAIHTRALSLRVAGVTAAVITFGAADNEEYPLTPAQALKLCEAPFDRASLLYEKARALKGGALATAVAAEDLAAIAAIDPADDDHWS